MKSEDDDVLILEYIKGRPEALQEIGRWIAKSADSRHWGLHNHRDDIFQEVHARLHRNLVGDKFRRGSSLKTYVSQITKYTCIEFLKKKIRYSAVDLDAVEVVDTNPDPEQILEAAEKRELAAEALAGLPKGCRQLFEMIFERKIPYQQISRLLDVAEGTVKSRAWRCRDLLMKKLRTKDQHQR